MNGWVGLSVQVLHQVFQERSEARKSLQLCVCGGITTHTEPWLSQSTEVGTCMHGVVTSLRRNARRTVQVFSQGICLSVRDNLLENGRWPISIFYPGATDLHQERKGPILQCRPSRRGTAAYTLSVLVSGNVLEFTEHQRFLVSSGQLCSLRPAD